MKIKHLVYLTVNVFFFGCESLGICKDSDLKFSRRDYIGDKLRLDGLYYGETYDSNGEIKVSTHYLFQNGVYWLGSTELLDDAKSGNIAINSRDNVKAGWGVYKIEGNEIELSIWQGAPSGCEGAFFQKGEILNDSSFLLEDEELYSFSRNDQKPDSTNNFIE